MSFTGSPVVKLVTDKLVRITGLSLDAGAQGIITNDSGGGGFLVVTVPLPAAWHPQDAVNRDGEHVPRSESVKVWWVPVAAGEGTFMPVVTIVKLDIGNAHGFAATFTNISAEDSPEMEIYLEFH
jgi:hypothetical protein